MSDFHDDITQTPTPTGGEPDGVDAGQPDGGGLTYDKIQWEDAQADPETTRQRLQEGRGTTQANEGAPAEESTPDERAGFGPPETKRPERVERVRDVDDEEAETPETPETPTETPETPTVIDGVIDDVIDGVLDAADAVSGAVNDALDTLVGPAGNGVMAPVDDDGRPIDTGDGDGDFGFGGVH